MRIDPETIVSSINVWRVNARRSGTMCRDRFLSSFMPNMHVDADWLPPATNRSRKFERRHVEAYSVAQCGRGFHRDSQLPAEEPDRRIAG